MLLKGHFVNVYNKNWVRSFRRQTLILDTSIFLIKFGTELPKVPHIKNYLNIKTSSLINITKSGRISLKRFGKRTENSKNLLFPICVNEEYKLDNSPKQLELCFRNSLIWNSGPYLLTRLWVRFSHLNEHKFCHNLGMLLNFCMFVGIELKQQTIGIVRFLQKKDKSSPMLCLRYDSLSETTLMI